MSFELFSFVVALSSLKRPLWPVFMIWKESCRNWKLLCYDWNLNNCFKIIKEEDTIILLMFQIICH